MKTGLLFSLFLASTIPLFSGQPAPLGRLLQQRLKETAPTDRSLVMVYLKDKGTASRTSSIDASTLVTKRSIARRQKMNRFGPAVTDADYPLEPSYVAEVAKHVEVFRHELKWFNAVSAIATGAQIEEIRHLPFVKEIELVGRWKKKQDDEIPTILKEPPAPSRTDQTDSLNYGTSLTQLQQINVPALHNMGIHGEGVIVGVFDNGFRLLTHETFAQMNIIAQHDFVDHKTSVIPNNPAGNFGAHGVNTLSTIGGYTPGQLIGPAFKASFILARTENDSSETPIEEDNWAAAIEWADSLGIDVSSTSLGYLTYDAPYTSWTWADMNGTTTLITQAADHAASLGIVVVNSAGNDAIARAGQPNTLIAPADGFDVITAGAVNSTGTRASFSSYGPTVDRRIKPDVMAMGVNVKVASSAITNGYGASSGTSFSCPLTAGVAALLVCANPTLTPVDIADALRQTASQNGSPDSLMGWGIVNALDALHANAVIPIGRISGSAFQDINGNGVKDPGDPPLAGAKIMLSGTMAESTLTDVSGNFRFDSLAIGSYTISYAPATGWLARFPASPYSVSLLHGTDTSGFSFGAFRLATASGTLFNDNNGNGVLDAGEPGLVGWTVHLAGPVNASTVTGAGGTFTFLNLKPGTYTISESSYAGWLQTVPPLNGSYVFTTRSGLDTTGLFFGNQYNPASNYSVLSGWNLLALPGEPADPRVTAVYPTAPSNAFMYSGLYVAIDTLRVGQGYWLKFPHAQNVYVPVAAVITDSIDVVQGWNIIGGASVPTAVSSLSTIPPGIMTSPLYGYGGSYSVADSLRPHHGYWVKSSGPGKVVIGPPSAASIGKQTPVSLSGFSEVSIEDPAAGTQSLYLSTAATEASALSRTELPPVPPAGAFDARFSTQRSAGILSPGHELHVLIQSSSPAVTVGWKRSAAGEGQIQFIERAGEKTIAVHDLDARPSFTIHPSPDNEYVLAAREVPSRVSLMQNYPNPFNPVTQIAYEVPEQSAVQIEVFDILGQSMGRIADGTVGAGSYTAEWNAARASSGIYFYRMTVVPSAEPSRTVTLVRRMMLLK